MIAQITGLVVEQTEKSIVIDVGGIGYNIFTNAIFDLGTVATLYTHLVIRDDAHELYGFAIREEKQLFNLLVSVSGVGPKSALAILSLYSLPVLVRHIKLADAKAISLVPGIGKKTAEKICIDLKDKISAFESIETANSNDLVEALLGLGYKEIQIRAIITGIDNELPIERQITAALQLLQKK
jgi:Holliday junction DNA helicase RuvA